MIRIRSAFALAFAAVTPHSGPASLLLVSE